MSEDSTATGSVCKNEWTWALRYKKPIITLRKDEKAEVPFLLNNRQYVDFTQNFSSGIAQLRNALSRLDSPQGKLDELKYRLADAQRDLRRAGEGEKARVQADVDDLQTQLKIQERIVADPHAAVAQTEKNIQSGLGRERQPESPISRRSSTKFINPAPAIAPTYFQDRQLETREVFKFLQDDAQRLMTVTGRGGVGKTAMVCRLLKGIENGSLPDDLGAFKVGGIVYLSETGSHRISFANIFHDLAKLLPAERAAALESLYKDPQAPTEQKMNALLAHFQGERILLLLDNFETLLDPATTQISDSELDAALRALLSGEQHAVNALITTRIAPRALNLYQPGRQRLLGFDEGLAHPYAENILREMDTDGHLGLAARPEEDADLQRARVKTRGYPRALEAFFAILASDRYTTLAELLEMPLPKNVIEALVGEAFSRLNTQAQKVIQALAIYNRPVSPAAVDYLLQPHLNEIDSAPILKRLTNMHFVRYEAGRFYLHPVDSEFALSLIALTPSPSPLGRGESSEARRGEGFTQYTLRSRAADYFRHARKPRAEWKSLPDLAAQLAEFDLRCAAGDFDTAASVLTEIDFDYLLLWGHYHLMISLHEKLQGKIENSTLARISLGNLGQALYFTGRVQEAISNYEKAVVSAKNDKNRQAEGAWLGNLGLAYADLGETKKAIDYYERALVIAREIGDRRGEGSDLGNLGIAYADLGEAQKAIEYHEQALSIAREIGDRRGQGNRLGNLGNAYAALGEAQKAIKYYEQALSIAREIGDRRGEGNHLGNLGLAYADLGEAKKAIEYHERALVIDREIGDRRGEGADLGNLGSAYADLGEAQKAIEYYEQALSISREIGDRRGEGSDLGSLASAYDSLGRLDEAIKLREKALEIQIEIGDKNGEGASLSILGSHFASLDNYEQAKKYFEKSLTIAKQTGYRYGEGFRLLNLALVEIETENYEAAIELTLQSIKIGSEIAQPHLQSHSNGNLALAYLLSENISSAQKTIEKAVSLDVPDNNHNIFVLHGILLLRQNNTQSAKTAFEQALAQAGEILAKTPGYYEALDAKGLALCGLAILSSYTDGTENTDDALETRKESVSSVKSVYKNDAIEIFKKARQIAPHQGVVKSVLRLFDELAKCEGGEILADVRQATGGR